MKRAFALAVILSLFLAESKAYDSRPAITVEDLKTMQPLPLSAKVRGTITALDKGFGDKLAFVLKLDNLLTCEVNTSAAQFSRLEVEKKGQTLVFVNKGTGQKYSPPDTVIRTLLIGEQATVSGLIQKKANGSIVLKGTMEALLR